MKNLYNFILFLFLVPLITLSVRAESLVDEGFRELEELRLRQLQTVQNYADIATFTTDGCSGGQSQSWELLAKILPGFERQFGDEPPWKTCCVTHDKEYWRGNTVDGYIKRKHADDELKQCVVDTGAELTSQLSVKYSVSEEEIRHAFSVTAEIMYRAVRLGGQPCSLLPWRWGYGWDNCAYVGVSDIKENYSGVKKDEHITFISTTGWLDTDKSQWHIPIHAWIYEPQNSEVRKSVIASLFASMYDLKITPENEENFNQRTNLMIADNERGKVLVIRIAGQDITLPASKENGHVFTILKLSADVVETFTIQGRLDYFAVTQPDDKRRFEGDVRLVSQQGISVISDIDDTIKISNVTDHKKLFDHTFFKDFHSVVGMSHLYQQLAARNATIHFVSSSPWQLYDPLNKFMHKAEFPRATMSLKYVRFRDETLINLFKKGTETKPKQIEPILQRYPKRQFILIGDSGEQDPEVYGDIARRYPSQIHRILIRNIDNSAAENERYKIAFKKIVNSKWQLFDQPEQVDVDKLLRTKQVLNSH